MFIHSSRACKQFLQPVDNSRIESAIQNELLTTGHGVQGDTGIILLPSGDDGRVISVTPPLCIERDALIAALEILAECIQ